MTPIFVQVLQMVVVLHLLNNLGVHGAHLELLRSQAVEFPLILFIFVLFRFKRSSDCFLYYFLIFALEKLRSIGQR